MFLFKETNYDGPSAPLRPFYKSNYDMGTIVKRSHNKNLETRSSVPGKLWQNLNS